MSAKGHRILPVTILRIGDGAQTDGLSGLIGYEVRLGTVAEDELAGANELLAFVAEYVTHHRARLMPEETMEYGLWIVKFRESEGGVLDVWERTTDGSRFQPGASTAIRFWSEQHEVCEHHGAPFAPPHTTQLAVLSAGVRDGEAVEGARYPSPEHMSGWWLSTDRYDGDVKALTLEHIYHVATWRPDLARYLALPLGWRFSTDRSEIWFDESVAKQPS
jgi:hypothetical protein